MIPRRGQNSERSILEQCNQPCPASSEIDAGRLPGATRGKLTLLTLDRIVHMAPTVLKYGPSRRLRRTGATRQVVAEPRISSRRNDRERNGHVARNRKKPIEVGTGGSRVVVAPPERRNPTRPTP